MEKILSLSPLAPLLALSPGHSQRRHHTAVAAVMWAPNNSGKSVPPGRGTRKRSPCRAACGRSPHCFKHPSSLATSPRGRLGCEKPGQSVNSYNSNQRMGLLGAGECGENPAEEGAEGSHFHTCTDIKSWAHIQHVHT